jgi:hypothetical protein
MATQKQEGPAVQSQMRLGVVHGWTALEEAGVAQFELLREDEYAGCNRQGSRVE